MREIGAQSHNGGSEKHVGALMGPANVGAYGRRVQSGMQHIRWKGSGCPILDFGTLVNPFSAVWINSQRPFGDSYASDELWWSWSWSWSQE